jgi:hypothetical protein
MCSSRFVCVHPAEHGILRCSVNLDNGSPLVCFSFLVSARKEKRAMKLPRDSLDRMRFVCSVNTKARTLLYSRLTVRILQPKIVSSQSGKALSF